MVITSVENKTNREKSNIFYIPQFFTFSFCPIWFYGQKFYLSCKRDDKVGKLPGVSSLNIPTHRPHTTFIGLIFTASFFSALHEKDLENFLLAFDVSMNEVTRSQSNTKSFFSQRNTTVHIIFFLVIMSEVKLSYRVFYFFIELFQDFLKRLS